MMPAPVPSRRRCNGACWPPPPGPSPWPCGPSRWSAIWHGLGSVGTPVLLVPLAASHFGGGATTVRARRGLAGIMIAAGVASLVWLLAGRAQDGLLFGVEPIFPGLAVSLLGVGMLRPGARST